MKLDLYIDFDGVILNTIDVSLDIYFKGKEREGYPPRDFYRNLDWDWLLSICHEINDSISNIAKLIDSNLFNVRILTHVVCENERQAKLKFLNSKFSDLEVIPVFIDDDKCDVVDAKGAILVDDYSGNLLLWDKAGGVAVKFSNKKKRYNYVTIDKLDSLIGIFPKLKSLVEEKAC